MTHVLVFLGIWTGVSFAAAPLFGAFLRSRREEFSIVLPPLPSGSLPDPWMQQEIDQVSDQRFQFDRHSIPQQ